MKKLEAHYKDKRVLVTGGAGFIGSHLVHKLVQLGARVTVLDNLSTGNITNLAPVLNSIHFIQGDICDTELCIQATDNQEFIFHLAAIASVPRSIENPEECYEVNVQGTKNLLNAANHNHVTHFVFSSSSAVYGNQTTDCKESMNPNPQSPYAESKLIGEALCKKQTYLYGLSTACLRYFNVYGERQNPNGDYAAVVAKFKDSLHAGNAITVFGDGTQTRDFISVESVVEANLLAGLNNEPECMILNIASGKSITILKLLEILEQELGKKNNGITFVPSRQGDILHSKADCDQFLKLKKQYE